ncbi:MAG: DUF945 family protein [Proteobacteria bacterium]|nr:DUF945 family protein [Pseudomonadota bacterium]
MKKGVLVLLVGLALVVMVSPGIVGMLAEKSVDEQIERATSRDQGLSITAERFDRGWFSSQGRHRIELQDANSAASIRPFLGLGDDDDLPVLIVDTELSHGLIALTALGDENGSLMPGLGRAVSTLSLEMHDGSIVALPGKVYSSLSLTGDLSSSYATAAGSQGPASWGDIEINFESAAMGGDHSYDGTVESLRFTHDKDLIVLQGASFAGDLEMSEFGFAVGDLQLALDSLFSSADGARKVSVGPVFFNTHSSINDGRLNSESELQLTIGGIPAFDLLRIDTRVVLAGVDGHALRRLVENLQLAQNGGNYTAIQELINESVLELIAAGADLNIERLEVSLPMGTIKAVMNIRFLESDRADFGWTSVLLAMEADATFEFSESLVDMAVMMRAELEIARSFLKKNGDVYEMDVAYKKALLTINGLPVAIPIL